MKKFDRSLSKASVFVTLAAVISLLVFPTIGARNAEAESGVTSVLVANTPSRFVPSIQSTTSYLNAFHFLEPLAPKSGDPSKFDASLLNYLSVEVCEVSGTDCTIIKSFTVQGASSTQLRIETNGKDGSYYIVNWDTQRFNFNRKTYRVRVLLAGLQLGAIDLTPDIYSKFGRTWPIKFLIEKDPVMRVRQLHSSGKSASQIVSVLSNEFGICGEDAAALLANDLNPFSASETDIAIQGVCQDVIIPYTTKVSDQATRNALVSYDRPSGQMIFSTDTPLLKNLTIGDVLVSEPSAAAPFGYLRKVTSIRKDRTQIVIETVQAKITEAISKGTLKAAGELLPSDVAATSLSSSNATLKIETPSINSLGAIDVGDEFNFRRDIDVTIDLAGSEGGASGTGTVHVQGFILFNAGYDVGVGVEICEAIPPVCVDRVEAHVDVNQKSNIKVTGQFDGKLQKEKVIDTIQFEPITFFIGPIPVVIVPTIDVIVGVDGEAHVDFRFAAEASSTLKLGAKWTDPDDGGQGWQDIREFNPLGGRVIDNDLNANLKVEGYGKANAKLLLYDVAGPGIGARIGLTADVHLGQRPLWAIYGHLLGDVNFSVDIGGVIDLENYSRTILDESFKVGEAANQIPQCNNVTDTITAEIGVEKTLGPRSGFEGYFACTDPEGEVPTYSAVSSNLSDGTNGVIPLRYAFQSVGLRTVTITASDSDGGSTIFTLKVDVHNSLPIVKIAAASTIPATVQFFMSAEAYDPDTNTFVPCDRFSWQAPPDTVTVLNHGGTCNAVVRFAQEGSRTVTVTATDQYGGVGSSSIAVTVTAAPTNRPPEIDLSTFSIRALTGPGDDRSCIGLNGTLCRAPDGSYLWSGFVQRLPDEYETPLYMKVVATDPEGDTLIYDWRCETGTERSAIIDEGDGRYSCRPIYASINGLPVPVKVYALVSDGINPSVPTLTYTYYFRPRTN